MSPAFHPPARHVQPAAKDAAPTRQAADPGAHAALHPRLARLVGRSALFVQQVQRVSLLAPCNAGVLVQGETGTGKELFAQALHYLSPRAGHPFVAVNCGALPAELVESELFGHARGAFTHAHEAQKGLVAQAQGGSLFLDEVDSLPLPAQVKLLRFLQDKEYRPVGSARGLTADVRLIAASNTDLWAAVQRGAFRADLFYRLNVLTLSLPALRQRPEDLLLLAQHFVERYAREFQRPVCGLSAAAAAAICAHRWPGNVRELQHAIERGVLLAPGDEVLSADLCLAGAASVAATDDGQDSESFQQAKARLVDEFERNYLEHLLLRYQGNITRAAGAACKNRRAFFELMKKHQIDSGPFRRAGLQGNKPPW